MTFTASMVLRHGAKIVRSVDQSIASGVTTQIAFDVVDFDNAGLATPPSITVGSGFAGLYLVIAQIVLASPIGAAQLDIGILVNGGPLALNARSTPGSANLGESLLEVALGRLSDGDVITVLFSQDSGVPVSARGFPFLTYLEAVRLGN